ncbi:MAG TPA: DNA-binding domain-containing protein [Gammaproteobacteria bacterium]|nr:DNA-binding domain-containing protein [Gammaproteobacteria bacterium]
MLTLLEIQSEMREAILAAPSKAILDEIVSDRIAARRRLNVYRNHFRESLVGGLAEVFPATRILVGARYFDSIAGVYVAARPPGDPRLSRYGRGFPRFLSARDELESSQFATEVARLEWSISEIGDAADSPLVEWVTFQRSVAEHAGAIAFQFSNAFALFECEWPVHEIRKRALAGAGIEDIAPLVETPSTTMLLLYRDRDDDVCELLLDDAGFNALGLLRAGRSFNQATRAALARHPGFPVTDFYRFLFQSGLVAGLSPIHASRRDAAKEN